MALSQGTLARVVNYASKNSGTLGQIAGAVPVVQNVWQILQAIWPSPDQAAVWRDTQSTKLEGISQLVQALAGSTTLTNLLELLQAVQGAVNDVKGKVDASGSPDWDRLLGAVEQLRYHELNYNLTFLGFFWQHHAEDPAGAFRSAVESGRTAQGYTIGWVPQGAPATQIHIPLGSAFNAVDPATLEGKLDNFSEVAANTWGSLTWVPVLNPEFWQDPALAVFSLFSQIGRYMGQGGREILQADQAGGLVVGEGPVVRYKDGDHEKPALNPLLWVARDTGGNDLQVLGLLVDVINMLAIYPR